MPSLMQSLQGQDLGYLRIIARLWNLDFTAPNFKVGLQRLIPLMLDEGLLAEIIETLPDGAKDALQDLKGNDGRIRWTQFTRCYGDIREMGAARRDREHPYIENASVSEILWYRGLIGKDFFDAPEGLQEFVYIPDEFFLLIPPGRSRELRIQSRKATSNEFKCQVPANDSILDETCILLAMVRKGEEYITDDSIYRKRGKSLVFRPNLRQLEALLTIAGLLDSQGGIQIEPVRKYLEASRGDALLFLANEWLNNQEFNELRMLPGLVFEGEWKNDPLQARKAILNSLMSLEEKPSISDDESKYPFWSLSSFISSIHQLYPDFQRSASDYDSWYIKDQTSKRFLRGSKHWDDVEGELIRFFIEGPLHWLGMIDLGLLEESGEVKSFRFSDLSSELLSNVAPKTLDPEQDKLQITSSGRITASCYVPRTVRYQVARFCDLESQVGENYHFRIIPTSLEAAKKQGLRISQLITLIQNNAKTFPPNLKNAIERWENHGNEIVLKRVNILQLSDAGTLKVLQSSRVSQYLEEQLSSTAVIIKEGAQEKVLSFLLEMGFLGEFEES